MGRLLGSHADDRELDRPDLNKCPDCGCFFPQDNCPLCGKPCPEEMRAGNRKPPKKSKKTAAKTRPKTKRATKTSPSATLNQLTRILIQPTSRHARIGSA